MFLSGAKLHRPAVSRLGFSSLFRENCPFHCPRAHGRRVFLPLHLIRCPFCLVPSPCPCREVYLLGCHLKLVAEMCAPEKIYGVACDKHAVVASAVATCAGHGDTAMVRMSHTDAKRPTPRQTLGKCTAQKQMVPLCA